MGCKIDNDSFMLEKNEMPRYSVIIPAYCCENTLAETVESVMNAQLEDYEIIIIDDGSTDRTPLICDMLAEKHKCIRCIHQENSGVSTARNSGIRMAKGEYILFLDSDDILRPFDGEVLGQLTGNHVDILIFGMVFQYYHKDCIVKEEYLHTGFLKEYTPATVAEDFLELFKCNYLSSACNKIFKRSLLHEKNIVFDSRLTNYEDLAFSLCALREAKKIVAVPQMYYQYKVNYNHDHTVDRIARISNIMENTDLIGEQFLKFERAVKPEGSGIKSIRKCLLGIYFEIFRVKMKTSSVQTVRKCCRDFRNDQIVQQLREHLVEMSPGDQRLCDWIMRDNVFAIWIYSKYLLTRLYISRKIKRIIRGIGT